MISVGRLDFSSEGLLLLTNDGALSRHLELPATGWARRYRARVFGAVTPEVIARLGKGMTVEGVTYGPIEVKIESAKGRNIWASVRLREGKNREIRKVFEACDCTVNRLIRTAYGPFQLGELPRGALKEVPAKVLRESLGKWMTDAR